MLFGRFWSTATAETGTAGIAPARVHELPPVVVLNKPPPVPMNAMLPALLRGLVAMARTMPVVGSRPSSVA